MSTFAIIAMTHCVAELNGLLASGNGDQGAIDTAIAAGAIRAGETGLVNLELLDMSDEHKREQIADALVKLITCGAGTSGIKYDATQSEDVAKVLDAVEAKSAPRVLHTVLTNLPVGSTAAQKATLVKKLKARKLRVLIEAISLLEALDAQQSGADAIVAKGHEAGGRVGDETSFVLLQQFNKNIKVPFYAQGGIGIHTAAAAYVAGAAGVVLDSQLLMAQESSLPLELKQKIANMDGTETTVTAHGGSLYRVFTKNINAVMEKLDEHDKLGFLHQVGTINDGKKALDRVWTFGQDIAFASDFAQKFSTVAGIAQAIKSSVLEHIKVAPQVQPLAPGSPLAVSHGTTYPLVQGAMTRVSDTADFALRVSQQGALPFLALALMRKNEVETLVSETKEKLGALPWGVGILGFVPQQLRQEQLEVISKYRPPFALIAGGRPDQAKALEDMGIKTYLHVPSPMLLESFIEMGSKRFIFEGKECGGHVGPRSSFTLWEAMVERILASIGPRDDASAFHVLFAGGVHDALSSAMIGAMSATLARRGVRVGALMGTAYLFTNDAVETGAIVEKFQQAAIECTETVLLETGPGHAIRCINSPYKRTFDSKREELILQNKGRDEIREELELMNLGRLRIASKGLTRPSSLSKEDVIAELKEQGKNQPALEELSADKQWSDGMYMIGQVASMHKSVFTIAELHQTVCAGGAEILERLQTDIEGSEIAKSDKTASEPIAIVGMSCLFPKANDLETYWENILSKVDTITEVPEDQWDWRNYYDPDPLARDKIYSKWGGFLQELKFDPTKYGIPPSSLASIDPMQVLLLEVTRAAIEDAGYSQRGFERERTSVVLANAGHGPITALYSLRSMLGWKLANISEQAKSELQDALPEWTEDSFPGYLGNVTAGRVANRFDLGGVNFSIDAACASSLAALYVGIAELRSNNSDVVFLAAADTHNQPGDYLSFSKTHAFSAQGRCRTFDLTADGIVISEGIAMVVLKRLSDAERDGDRIYAVLRGIGGSSDGRDLSLTAPRPAGQMLALRRAYADAGVSPSSVSLVEAHGTGTVAGDRAEIEAMKQVFEESGADKRGCAVGSVKTMIGHSKAAAGLASLIKVAKALHHKVLPPTMGVTQPNPACDFENSPFYINSESRPWIHTGDDLRRAGVSAFGFGGTNFHAVVEEYVPVAGKNDPAATYTWPSELFLLAGKSRLDLMKGLETVSDSVKRALKADESVSLRELAQANHIKQTERHADPSVRELSLAIVASSIADLQEKILRAKSDLLDNNRTEIKDPRGIYFVDLEIEKEVADGKIAFLFPGQGSQQVDMLRELATQFPEIRKTFEQASKVLANRFEKPLNAIVFPPPAFTDAEKSEQMVALTNTHVAQPAIGAADLGMLKVLRSFGLAPDMVAGHSYGEYVALHAAGVFSESDLFKISEIRGRILSERNGGGTGTMAAVASQKAQVNVVLKETPGVTLANINSPNQCIVSGEESAVNQALEAFKKHGLVAKLIPVSQAFHSAHMKHAQAPLQKALSCLPLLEPTLPVYCNTDSGIYAKSSVVDRLTKHIVEPVDFASQLSKMYDDGARTFIEVGPSSVLSGLAEATLSQTAKGKFVVVATDRAARNGLTNLLHCLAILAAHGRKIDISRLFTARSKAFEPARQFGRNLNATTESKGRSLLYLVNSAHIKRIDSKDSAKSAKVSTTQTAPAPKTPSKIQPASVSNAPGIRPPEIRNPIPASMNNTKQPEQPKAIQPIQSAPGQPPLIAPAQIAAPQPVALNALMPTAGKNVDQVMLQFQQTMLQMTNSFLQTQQQVMLAYLQAKGAAAAAPAQYYMPLQAIPAQPQQLASPVLQTMPQEIAPQSQTFESQMAGAQLLNTLMQVEASAVEPTPVDVHHNGNELPELLPTGNGNNGSSNGQDPEVLVDALMDIVSQKTGYPIDMLDPTLDLEADLGIDSIKRVEILNSFRKMLPQEKQLELESGIEELAGTKTLQGIINWIRKTPCDAPGIETEHNGNGHDNGNGHGPENGKGQVIQLPTAHNNGGNGHNGHNGNNGNNGHGQLHLVTDAQKEIVSGSLLRRGLVKSYKLPALHSADLPEHGIILIAADEAGFAQALIASLLKQKKQVAVLAPNTLITFNAPAYKCQKWSDVEELTKVISAIGKEHGKIGAFINLRAFDTTDACENLRLLTDQFAIAKALEPHFNAKNTDAKRQFINAARMDGQFGLTNSAKFSPLQAGLVGMTKSLAKEWSNAFCKAIDFSIKLTPASVADLIVRELASQEPLVETGYDENHRYALEIVATSLDDAKRNQITVNSTDVILITGGARGITAEIARELATKYQPKMVLVGRLAEPPSKEDASTAGLESPKEIKAAIMEQLKAQGKPVSIAAVETVYQRLLREREVRGTLAELRELGSTVEYHDVDVRNAAAFGQLIDEIYKQHGKIDGVIHGAGIIDDGYTKDKSVESFHKVVSTKVDSAFTLSEKLRLDSLRFMFLFSSVVGRTGNAGQTDYVAANETVNKLAMSLDKKTKARVSSIMWGPWKGGMAQPELESIFAKYGWAMIDAAAGRAYFIEELEFGSKGDVEVLLVAELTGEAALPKVSGPRLYQASPSFIKPGSFQFAFDLNPEHDLYLKDHTFDGIPVMPMAFALELMAEAVTCVYPGYTLRKVQRLDIPSGIVFDAPSKPIAIVTDEVSRSEVGVRVQVSLNTGAPLRRTNFKASMELVRSEIACNQTLPQLPPDVVTRFKDVSELAVIEDRIDVVPGPADIYGQILFHGPIFQGIKAISALGSSGILGTVKASEESSCFADTNGDKWVIDPVLFDSSMQLAGVWARQHLDITVLPTGFRTLHVLSKIQPGEELFGRIFINPGTTARELTCELGIYHQNGELALLVEGLGGVGSKSLNRLASQANPLGTVK